MVHNQKMWYFESPEGLKGPVSSLQLMKLALSGDLSHADKVQNGEWGKWITAKKNPGLFGCIKAESPIIRREFQVCPSCRESNYVGAYGCKYCGSFLD